MGGVRRNTAKDDTVFEATLHDFEGLVCPEAVTNENSWFLIRLCFGLGIEHKFDPVQADLGVGVARQRARRMPFRGRIRSSCASMDCGWPKNQWKERPTVCRNALNRSHHCSLDTRASIISQVVLTY